MCQVVFVLRTSYMRHDQLTSTQFQLARQILVTEYIFSYTCKEVYSNFNSGLIPKNATSMLRAVGAHPRTFAEAPTGSRDEIKIVKPLPLA